MEKPMTLLATKLAVLSMIWGLRLCGDVNEEICKYHDFRLEDFYDWRTFEKGCLYMRDLKYTADSDVS